ncbi:MAG: RnfH family protein [Porticoccaceae bacterium]|nr:RnfH family protein [Porticoccaceae bacterium]
MTNNEKNTQGNIAVEVVYGLPEKQKLIQLEVAVGTTAYQAVEQSGILQSFPEIDLPNSKMGIFAQVLGAKGLPEPDAYQLQERDRVEIYRPLIADPKEVRRRRAEEAKLKKEQEG